jgi:phospholipid-binding lipoprotein MlaA
MIKETFIFKSNFNIFKDSLKKICLSLVFCVFSGLCPSACALQIDHLHEDTTQPLDETATTIKDPLEPFNRLMFDIHEVFDGLFLQPIAQIYELVTHPYIQDRVHHVLQNLSTPSIFINDCLQGETERAWQSLARFLVNSTFGLCGLYDFAADIANIQPHQEDFGQTLAVYQIDSGPYLFIPILGPSSLRDFIGTVVDFVIDPVNYIFQRNHKRAWVYVRTGGDALDQRTQLLPITNRLAKTYDPYTSYKILYVQNRDFNIKNGNIERETPTPDEE